VLLIIKHIGELNAALRVDGHFEGGNAAQAPGDIGERLDEFGFFETNGLQFLFVGGDVALVFGSVVGGKQNGGAGEARFDRVQRGGAPAFFATRAGAEKGVRTVSGELSGRNSGRWRGFGRDWLELAGG